MFSHTSDLWNHGQHLDQEYLHLLERLPAQGDTQDSWRRRTKKGRFARQWPFGANGTGEAGVD